MIIYKLSMDMSKILFQIKSFARSKNLPIIPIDAKDVSIISEPGSFYGKILESINGTKKRLALSALYFGVGPKENSIVQAIDNNLRKNPRLLVDIVLDAHRATRQDNGGKSSVTTLENILKHNNLRLKLVDAGRNKTFISAFMKKFQKLNEISSTYHSKLLLFDNDVILTGANLSDIYFDKRQDRYIIFKNSELLSNYLHELLDIVDESSNLRTKVDQINEKNTKRLLEFEESPGDSWVIPLIQHGPSGILDSDEFLIFLSSIIPKTAQIHLSSGYFNPSPAISSLKFTSVLAPSEETNGFYGGKGLLKYIPRLYSALHEKFLRVNKKCKLYLYNRSGWSFHAKGLWVEGLNDVYVHHFGSSNYNFRSSERDFETQFILLTKNKSLIEELEQERKSLWKESSIVERDQNQQNFIIHMVSKLLQRYL